MRILAVITGQYGQRHVENIRAHAPDGWTIHTWTAPVVYPPFIDYPEDFLPGEWYAGGAPGADLVLSFGEHKGVAELLPEIARLTGARAVIAPVDNEAWLPRGLARQVRGWLGEVTPASPAVDGGGPTPPSPPAGGGGLARPGAAAGGGEPSPPVNGGGQGGVKVGVVCVTPKPLCSLTETGFGVGRGKWETFDPRAPGYDLVAEFARYFGRPELEITVTSGRVEAVTVVRDAVCGCTRFVAEGLVGVPVEEAVQKAGLLHHHYPCLASMAQDGDFGDTLMHVSGNVLKDQVREALGEHGRPRYFVPG